MCQSGSKLTRGSERHVAACACARGIIATTYSVLISKSDTRMSEVPKLLTRYA